MVPSRYGAARNLKLQHIIEDPILRDSQHSFMHQMNDVLAYCAKQMFEPNAYRKKKDGRNYYKRLGNVSLNVVSTTNPHGVVVL